MGSGPIASHFIVELMAMNPVWLVIFMEVHFLLFKLFDAIMSCRVLSIYVIMEN